MDNWSVKINKDFSPSNPIFIEGLPGIGNVGKIAVDYIADFLDAKKVVDFFSFDMPAHVYIDETNLVESPSLSLYHKSLNGIDYLFLRGELQPSSERATYEFTNLLLDLLKKWSCTSVVATGGIGLMELPLEPEVFVTGTSKDFCDTFVEAGANNNVFGLVGPIVGVSGLLVGLGKLKNIPSAALLVETFVHPTHVGLKESKILASLIDKLYSLSVDFTELDNEIAFVQEELDSPQDDAELDKSSSKYKKLMKGKDLNYIG